MLKSEQPAHEEFPGHLQEKVIWRNGIAHGSEEVRHETAQVFRPPLSTETQAEILAERRAGKLLRELAEKYGRSLSRIGSILTTERAKSIFALPLEYIQSPEFDEPDADQKIFAPLPPEKKFGRRSKPPAGLPPYLASMYDTPLLTPQEEQCLFRRYNYLKHKANELRKTLDPQKPSAAVMAEIESLHAQAIEVKKHIAGANLRLVVSVSKKYISPQNDLFELVSDGNISLLQAIQKFDYMRGFKFSTYATWAIKNNFARSIPNEFRQRGRFRTGREEMLHVTADRRVNELRASEHQKMKRESVRALMSSLDEREKIIICMRFGLDEGSEPKTLKEVGEELGVTKERIRQLQDRALGKMQCVAQEKKIPIDDLIGGDRDDGAQDAPDNFGISRAAVA